jgi:peptidoglycan/LPS O-acetylase OafA/YrhL
MTRQAISKDPPAFQSGRHYEELDSLRGLAALSVLIGHYLNLFRVESGPFVSIGRGIALTTYTPLYALMAGHEAVVFFFVLSGFVLSLQFLKNKPVQYGSFAIKRIFRIYVPYLATLIVALACCQFFYSGRINDLSSWFNGPWSERISGTAVRDHFIFLGYFKSDRFDPVLWSLVHELRISLVFPLLVAFLLRRTWKVNLAVALALCFLGTTVTLAFIKFKIHNYSLTVQYVPMFIVGFLLAQNIRAIWTWYRKMPAVFRVGCAGFGFVLYTFSHLLPGRISYFADVPTAIGAALMVITGLCSTRTSTFLKQRVVKFFGDISYSLYLYHAVVLLSLTHIFYGRIPIGIILVMAATMTVVVSWLSYKYIELPAIKGGKFCSARWESLTVPSRKIVLRDPAQERETA